jgi:fluoroacetyl-CoA thioesterase
MIETGYVTEAEFVVQHRDTAAMLALDGRDRFPEVFATFRMIALMELAAARAMHPLLQPGQLSVGVGLEVRHTAATRVGCLVRGRATFLRHEGKFMRFKVEAFDQAGLIGEGEHTRAVVDHERLMTGAARRVSAAAA